MNHLAPQQVFKAYNAQPDQNQVGALSFTPLGALSFTPLGTLAMQEADEDYLIDEYDDLDDDDMSGVGRDRRRARRKARRARRRSRGGGVLKKLLSKAGVYKRRSKRRTRRFARASGRSGGRAAAIAYRRALKIARANGQEPRNRIAGLRATRKAARSGSVVAAVTAGLVATGISREKASRIAKHSVASLQKRHAMVKTTTTKSGFQPSEKSEGAELIESGEDEEMEGRDEEMTDDDLEADDLDGFDEDFGAMAMDAVKPYLPWITLAAGVAVFAVLARPEKKKPARRKTTTRAAKR